MAYSVWILDSWGRVNVGRFSSLEQAREVFGALCQDRWCNDDGTVRGVLIEADGPEGGNMVAIHRFEGDSPLG